MKQRKVKTKLIEKIESQKQIARESNNLKKSILFCFVSPGIVLVWEVSSRHRERPKVWSSFGCSYLRKRKRIVFLSSYRNTSGSLGEREMLWEHEPQASVSTAFSSSPKLSRVFL